MDTTTFAAGTPVSARVDLGYDAAAFGPPVTDSDRVAQNDAVLRRAARVVTFRANASPGVVLAAPSIVVGDGRGWSRTLAEASIANGAEGAQLDLQRLDDVLRHFERAAGAPPGRYSVRVSVGARTGKARWSAVFVFDYDRVRLAPAAPGKLRAIHPVPQPDVQVAHRIALLPGGPSVSSARRAAGGVTVAAILLLAGWASTRRRIDPEGQIRRAGVPIVSVDSLPATQQVVALYDADALVRFSQALGRPVLHVAGGTVFAVVVEDTTYLLHGQSPELPPLRNVA
jgi:hypothetical protein